MEQKNLCISLLATVRFQLHAKKLAKQTYYFSLRGLKNMFSLKEKETL
jgi:hypothetical protein